MKNLIVVVVIAIATIIGIRYALRYDYLEKNEAYRQGKIHGAETVSKFLKFCLGTYPDLPTPIQIDSAEHAMGLELMEKMFEGNEDEERTYRLGKIRGAEIHTDFMKFYVETYLNTPVIAQLDSATQAMQSKLQKSLVEDRKAGY